MNVLVEWAFGICMICPLKQWLGLENTGLEPISAVYSSGYAMCVQSQWGDSKSQANFGVWNGRVSGSVAQSRDEGPGLGADRRAEGWLNKVLLCLMCFLVLGGIVVAPRAISPIAVHFFVALSSRSVCLSVTFLHAAQVFRWILMPLTHY